ncbi:MAG TPA: non-homologous end-joining DNA ligase [Rhizomicrobium sp.]|nr:non-homologous end-joining DNA ligase [Rhizomicrobium sp.]
MPDPMPTRVRPMLATLVAEPFRALGWIFEEKYDGDRVLAYKDGRRVRMLSRNGIDRTDSFSAIADAIGALAARQLILDGEVIVRDRHGVSQFQLLQQRKGKTGYAVFDCLFRNGRDLRREPLSLRREELRAALKPGRAVFVSRRLSADGIKAFREAKKRGFEGIVAKNLASAYVGKRSRDWLKVKVHQEDEFVIVGFTRPAGARKHFGALLLAARDKGELRFAGKVGTGFDARSLAELHARLAPLAVASLKLANAPRERGVTFVKPRLVAQIHYRELTADKKLRQPVYLGLRSDKRASEVEMPVAAKVQDKQGIAGR